MAGTGTMHAADRQRPAASDTDAEDTAQGASAPVIAAGAGGWMTSSMAAARTAATWDGTVKRRGVLMSWMGTPGVLIDRFLLRTELIDDTGVACNGSVEKTTRAFLVATGNGRGRLFARFVVLSHGSTHDLKKHDGTLCGSLDKMMYIRDGMVSFSYPFVRLVPLSPEAIEGLGATNKATTSVEVTGEAYWSSALDPEQNMLTAVYTVVRRKGSWYLKSVQIDVDLQDYVHEFACTHLAVSRVPDTERVGAVPPAALRRQVGFMGAVSS